MYLFNRKSIKSLAGFIWQYLKLDINHRKEIE